MWAWVDGLGAAVLDGCVGVTLLFGLVTPALLLCRQPARRLLVARAALGGALALPLLMYGSGLPRLDLVTAFRQAGHGHFSPRGWVEAAPQGPPASPTTAAGPLFTAEADYAPVGPSWLGGNPLSRALTLLYVTGVACGLAWLGLGWALLAALRGRSWPASEGSRALYESLPWPPGRSRPGLRVAARVGRPVLVGLVRPLILVPPGLDEPEAADRLRLSLLHELAHAEARDPWYGLVGNLAQTAWFFLPPVWWVWARMRLDQEFLADRRAAAAFGRPLRAYASSLLDLAAARRPPEAAGNAPDALPWPGPAAEQDSPLVQRVAMLLRNPFPIESRPPAWWAWGLPAVVAVVTLAASSLTVRSAGPADDAAGPNTFRMARLDLPAAGPGAAGRVELPVKLPAAFDLTLDVWGTAAALAHSRVAGVPLGPPDAPEAAHERPDWHRVRLRRSSARDATLQVDGIPTPLLSLPPEGDTWLTLEPAPGTRGVYRDLALAW